MAKRKRNALGEILGAICLGACAVGFVVGVIKAASLEKHCPWCDKVLSVVNAMLLFCPTCKRYLKVG